MTRHRYIITALFGTLPNLRVISCSLCPNSVPKPFRSYYQSTFSP